MSTHDVRRKTVLPVRPRWPHELVRRLNEILPGGFRATYGGGTHIEVATPHRFTGAAFLGEVERHPDEIDPLEAPAGARVTDGVLHCWYGDEHAPVVALRPLPLRK